jgi:hypothetical protein
VTLNGSGSSDPGGEPLTFTWSGPFGTASGPNPTVTLPPGIWLIALTVDDGYGGTASDQIDVTVQDVTPPVISGAGQAITVSTTSPSGTPVSLPPVTASDNCGPVTVAHDAPAVFPIGTTTVTFSAVDTAGNRATATDSVTVVRVDDDGDGVQNTIDQCPASQLAPAVVIDGCNSGVVNTVFPSGCTITDLIAQIAAQARNHAVFVVRVSVLTNFFDSNGVISSAQNSAIQQCAARAGVP